MWEARDRKTREQQQALDEKLSDPPESGLTASAKERIEEFVEDIKDAWVQCICKHGYQLVVS